MVGKSCLQLVSSLDGVSNFAMKTTTIMAARILVCVYTLKTLASPAMATERWTAAMIMITRGTATTTMSNSQVWGTIYTLESSCAGRTAAMTTNRWTAATIIGGTVMTAMTTDRWMAPMITRGIAGIMMVMIL